MLGKIPTMNPCASSVFVQAPVEKGLDRLPQMVH
ncbi:hypothetical protein C5167_004236 [Papaver somniferum]|nr:hypothetical protein C5167_004236 [Papaver somniferum]